ncbi:related to spindle assembly checkpoint protein (N-terminal fragment), partial [Ustilago hordei]
MTAGGSGIPMRSGIPRPGTSTSAASISGNAESAIPRPSSRMSGAASNPPRQASGPMGAYRSTTTAGRSSTGSNSGAPPPSSAAPSTHTYGGLAGRISTLQPRRPLDPNPSNHLLYSNCGADDASSQSILLDTSLGMGLGHKRTLSAAGFTADDSNVSFSASAIKRRHLRKLSMDGRSPLLLQAELHPASTPRPESPAYEVALLRTHYDQQLLSESLKYKKLEKDFESKCKELDRFNRQRIELLDEWDKHQQSTCTKEAEFNTKRQLLEDQVARLGSLNSELTHKLDEATCNSALELSQLREKVTILESDLGKTKAEAQSAEVRAKVLEDDLGASKAELDDLRQALEDEQRMRLAERDQSRFGGEEGSKIAEELARQTWHLRKLEAENAHLVAENGRLCHQAANVELLKEEKRSLEAKLRTLDSLRDQLAAAESKIEESRQREKEWDALLRTGKEGDVEAAFSAAAAHVDSALPTISPPEVVDRNTLPNYLSALRGTVTGLEARCRALTTTVEKLRKRNGELQEEAKDVDSHSRQSQTELISLQTLLARAQKAESRMQDETTRLKTILASYEEEEKNHTDSTCYSAAHTQRIALLEGELEQVRSEHAKLVEEFETVSKALCEKEGNVDGGEHLQSKMDALLSEKAVLEGKVAQLTAGTAQMAKELEGLSKENESLWLRVGRGEFDQQRQRCLVLSQNPVSLDLDLRRKTLDALKLENTALLARVSQLSTQLATNPTTKATTTNPTTTSTNCDQALIPQSVVHNLRSDLTALQVSMAAKEKAMLRLKQVFSAKAKEFREAIESLFGYKVKFLENGKVKVTSTFNRSKNSTSLIFESEGGDVGKMKLMGEAVKSPGLVNLKGLKEYWLHPNGIRQSVPCFLAALNLELYEGCTMAVRG